MPQRDSPTSSRVPSRTSKPVSKQKSSDSTGRRRVGLRRGSSILMPNQYLCETEFDELNPDDSIIDHASISEDSFVLIVLLTTNCELCVFYTSGQDSLKRRTIDLRAVLRGIQDPVAICLAPDASFLVIACGDCSLHVVPTKNLLNVNWGNDKSALLKSGPFHISISTSSIAMDVKLVPASIKCTVSLANRRYIAVMATKGGAIFIVDLDAKKCIVELTSPQSIHSIEVVKTSTRIDLLFTSFLDSQWVIPLENNGRSCQEVLATLIPSELKQLSPNDCVYHVSGREVSALSSRTATLEQHPSLETIGYSPLSKYKIPPDTVMTWPSSKVLFAVSPRGDTGLAELRCAIHFGLTDLRLDYTIIRGSPEWRILSFVPLSRRPRQLPSCYLITERGLALIRQNPSCQLEDIVAEFLFRLPEFTADSLARVCVSAELDLAAFKATLIPRILATRTQKKLRASELARILQMGKVVELNIETLVDLFSKNEQEHNLLNEVLRVVEADKRSPVKCRVVDLFAKKCLTGKEREDYVSYRQKKDGELGAFLSRHSDIIGGIESILLVPLWKSAHILGSRTDQATVSVLQYIIKYGRTQFDRADGTVRSQMLSCVSQLKWTSLKAAEVDELIGVLCSWVVDSPSISLSENCLRLANQHAEKFPDSCSILYCAAAVYLLSEDGDRSTLSVARPNSLTCGLNSAAAITYDDRLLVWGRFSTEQANAKRAIESPRRNSSAASTPSHSPRKEAIKTLPRPVHIGSRPLSVVCGTEHVLVLTHTGEIYSWGNNRFGQCGVGNSVPVTEPQLLQGDWSAIKQLSAGQFHSALLCEDGSLWTWGWGLFGQLGHGPRSIADYFEPKRVEGINTKIKSVSCGRVHTILLMEEGQILIAGSGSYGQLGTNEDVKKCHTFLPLATNESVKFVMATTRFYHSLAVTEDGRLFEWGRNPQEMKMKMFLMRRLRNSNTSELRIKQTKEENEESPAATQNSRLPVEVPRDDLGLREVSHLLDGKVVAMSTGLSHSAVITDQGSLFSWGKALEYQLGHGNKSERSEPHQVFEPSDVQWKFVECGGNHTVAATSDGRIFSWGRNDFTQCGMPSERSNASTPKRIYYGKEGQRKCVQLADDSSFVAKPALISDLQMKIPISDDPVKKLDESMLIKHLTSAQGPLLEKLASLFSSKPLAPSFNTSVHLALCYLMAGNIEEAISQTGRAAQHFGQTPEVSAMASLAWEIIANHEDVQKKDVLASAFQCLPLTQTQRNSSQLRNLWPNVWDNPDCQRNLTAKEKLTVLESWSVDVKPLTTCELPVSSLRVGTARVRVWGHCGHTEQAALGVPMECSTCAEEWKDKARLTLGTD